METTEHKLEAGLSNRGSAIILVLMIVLALSAAGIVVVQATVETAKQTRAYRIQQQTESFAEAAVMAGAARAGMKAPNYRGMMQHQQKQDLAGTSGQTRDSLINRGGLIRFQSDGGPSGTAPTYPFNTPADSSSHLMKTSSIEGMETQKPSRFETIVRDPVTIPAPGYGEQFCFKKVAISSEATMGECTADSECAGSATCQDFICSNPSSPNTVARKQAVMEVLLGPMNCEGQGS